MFKLHARPNGIPGSSSRLVASVKRQKHVVADLLENGMDAAVAMQEFDLEQQHQDAICDANSEGFENLNDPIPGKQKLPHRVGDHSRYCVFASACLATQCSVKSGSVFSVDWLFVCSPLCLVDS